MKTQFSRFNRFFRVGKPVILLVLFGAVSVCLAIPPAVKVADTLVDDPVLVLSGGSWGDIINGVSFQQDAVVTHLGWQYVTYYNAALHVCIARRQLPDGAWQNLELTDYTYGGVNDAHNVISMGICPNDGTIHLSFDYHCGTFHYQVSQTGAATDPNAITWGPGLFGSVRNTLEAGKPVSSPTYPRFWQTPTGDLQFYYRSGCSGGGDSMLADYDAATGLWKDTRMVISRTGLYSDVCGSSTSRNAYLNYPGYGPNGVLHWTWVWRESAGGTNHDICYAYSEDGGYTWYNDIGPLQEMRIGTGGEPKQTLLNLLWTQTVPKIVGRSLEGLPITVSSDDIIAVPMTREYSLMNQQSQAIDPQGRVHTVMYYETDKAGCDVWAGSDYHHYWRDLDGTWHHTMLPVAMGRRPKLFIRDNGDAFLMFLRGGSVVIAAATAQSNWTDWQEIAADNIHGPYQSEGAGDLYRFRDGDGVLSIMAQAGSTLRILDFQLQ